MSRRVTCRKSPRKSGPASEILLGQPNVAQAQREGDREGEEALGAWQKKTNGDNRNKGRTKADLSPRMRQE